MFFNQTNNFYFINFDCFVFPNQSGEEPPSQGFTLKSVSSMIFGQDSLETKHEKLRTAEEQVKDAEELVKIAENDVKY